MVKSTRFLLPLFLVFLSSELLFGQFGVTILHKWMNAPNWGDYFENPTGKNPYPVQTRAFGFDYWFRAKNKRVEFTPEVSYEKYEHRFDRGSVKHTFYNFGFNVNIYPFDFEGDCDCPTWSKQGDFFSKGFFIQLSPGVSLLQNEYSDSHSDSNNENAIVVFFGIGAGLDIGLSDFLTVTPLVRLNYAPSVSWPGFHPQNRESSILQTAVGIRLGLRLDQ